MGVVKGREAVRALRPAMRSPGRPPPGRREHRERFWEGIAGGLSSEDAGVAAGVSAAVGSRWFRENGGMAPFVFASVSGRYLSFVEREEIAVLHARDCGVREIARRLGRCASTISRELGRNAATRSRGFEYRATTAQWHSDRCASRPKVSKLAWERRPCATMWRIVWVGKSLDRMASWCQGPRCVGSVAVMGPERIDGGQHRGALSRSRIGSGSTFRLFGNEGGLGDLPGGVVIHQK